MGVPDFWEEQVENRAKCEKMVIFPELKQGLFQVVSDTSEHSILHLFSPNSLPSNLKKHQIVFLDKFQTVPSCFTL